MGKKITIKPVSHVIQWQPIQGRDVRRGRYLLRQPNCLYSGNRRNKPGFVVELKAAKTVDVKSDVQKEGMAMLMWYLWRGGWWILYSTQRVMAF